MKTLFPLLIFLFVIFGCTVHEVKLLNQTIQNTAVSGLKPLIILAIFALLGSFSLGALVTAIRRGINEEGWFNFKNK